MQTIELPISEYQRLQEELSLLKDNKLLERVNQLVEILYQDKYGLYLGEYTDDLTENVVGQAWEDEQSEWDKV